MIIGIDLGTTNSLVCAWVDGSPTFIPNILGENLTPSVVGLDDQGALIVGAPARERLQTHPDLTIACFKRFIGSEKTIKLGKKKYRAEELSSFILKSLKADAQAYLQHPITGVVISVPAYFNDIQRQATRTAGRLAGLNVRRLVNEPTAAALAHGLHLNQDSTFLVLDIGGGTFDISIMEIFDGVMQIRASAGDNQLGGEDFVNALVAYLAKTLHIQLNRLTSHQLANLRKTAQQAIWTLSNHQSVTLNFNADIKMDSLELNRSLLQEIMQPLLARLRRPVERAVKDAGMSQSEFDALVLVGGASRMPIIRRFATQLVGLLPTASQNPDEIVCQGIGVQIGLMINDATLEEIVLTDVAPFSLGIDIHNEHGDKSDYKALFHPVIERNTPVPVSRSEVFFNVRDNQTSIDLNIYQGEQRFASDNIKLGSMTLKIPPKPAGESKIEVRFTYDINGLLEIDTQILGTEQRKKLIIEGNPGAMTEKEIKQRFVELADIKIHPRDKVRNTTLLERGARLYEENTGHLRLQISSEVSAFEAALNNQDHQTIESAAHRLHNFFDIIEKI